MAETAVEMAQRIIASKEKVSVETVLDLADIFLASLAFPPAIPFAIVAAAIAIPVERLNNKLQAANHPMPKSWMPAVWGTASDDGRFFVGRLLHTQGSVSISDAIKFLAVEKEATKREQYDTHILSENDAWDQLIAYYKENQTLFDKAVVLVGEGLKLAATGAVNAFKAATKKIRIGF